MGQRDFAVIIAMAVVMTGALSGCFTTQLVRTDTMVSYELLRAPMAPPAVPEDAVVLAPSAAPAGSTWMEPYWQWYGGQYTWMTGRWIPTVTGYAFLQPRWARTHDGWAFSGGGWAEPSGRIIAAPPAATMRLPSATASATCGDVARDPSPTPADATMATAAPMPSEPRSHARVDHTVTLGHRSYAPLRIARDPDDGSDERASASWITTHGAHSDAPSRSSAPVTRGSYGAPSTSSASIGSTSSYGSRSSGSTSSSSSAAPTYAVDGSSSAYASSSAASSGYASGSGSAQSSFRSGGASVGSSASYGGGGMGFSGSSVRP